MTGNVVSPSRILVTVLIGHIIQVIQASCWKKERKRGMIVGPAPTLAGLADIKPSRV